MKLSDKCYFEKSENLCAQGNTFFFIEGKGQISTLLPIPNVILEKVSTLSIAVGNVMNNEHVLDIRRVIAGSWHKLMVGEESNPKEGIQLDLVMNCNTFSKVICTFLGSVLRNMFPSVQLRYISTILKKTIFIYPQYPGDNHKTLYTGLFLLTTVGSTGRVLNIE